MTRALFPDGVIPISGEVQFWRMDPEIWSRALGEVRDLGIGTIATYLSWRRHEPVPGSFDLRGAHGPELDVHRFLRLSREAGLRVILKPGPWICAEEHGGGLPDWVLTDESLWARDYRGHPVIGYNPPFRHPMPSYASGAFRAMTARWLTQVWSDLAEFVADDGPVVATQYDNEPSLGFQDWMYGFDHHPDSLASWHRFAGEDVAPPHPRVDDRVAPTDVERLWATWQREYLTEYLVWWQRANAEAGAPELTGTVNLNTHPVRGWPQDGRTLSSALPGTVVGEDHYFVPPLDDVDLAGLALAAAQGAQSGTALVWAPEMQAGIWRSPGELIDYRDPTATELLGWWGAALALGYRGFNLYMLVDRENWEGAPIGRNGRRSDLGDALAAFLAEIAKFPDLAAFEPEVEQTLAWTDAARISAYRVRGTQASPLTCWDVPRARADYELTEAAALEAVRAGRQFALGEMTTRPCTARVEVPHGYLARIHSHPDGRRLLLLVRWAADVADRPVHVSLLDPTIAGVTGSTGDFLLPEGASELELPEPRAGITVYKIHPRPGRRG